MDFGFEARERMIRSVRFWLHKTASGFKLRTPNDQVPTHFRCGVIKFFLSLSPLYVALYEETRARTALELANE